MIDYPQLLDTRLPDARLRYTCMLFTSSLLLFVQTKLHSVLSVSTYDVLSIRNTMRSFS